eukprot:3935167-Rhodomonas_salina.1
MPYTSGYVSPTRTIPLCLVFCQYRTSHRLIRVLVPAYCGGKYQALRIGYRYRDHNTHTPDLAAPGCMLIALYSPTRSCRTSIRALSTARVCTAAVGALVPAIPRTVSATVWPSPSWQCHTRGQYRASRRERVG